MVIKIFIQGEATSTSAENISPQGDDCCREELGQGDGGGASACLGGVVVDIGVWAELIGLLKVSVTINRPLSAASQEGRSV